MLMSRYFLFAKRVFPRAGAIKANNFSFNNYKDIGFRAVIVSSLNILYRMTHSGNGNITGGGRRCSMMNGLDVEGKTPFLIGVAGGTASGKSTVCKRIMEKLGQVDMEHTERQVVCISQDAFYRELTPQEKIRAEKGQFNFDHPDAFDNDLILTTLQDILAGKKVDIPVYDYRRNAIIPEASTVIYPADVVLFEGILVFYFSNIRDLFHMKLFVDTDSDTRLARRVPRDIVERGRDLDQVLNQYMNFVKPAFEEFCFPTKKCADVIIPRGADNTVAIDLIVHHIWDIVRQKNPDTVNGDDQASIAPPRTRMPPITVPSHLENGSDPPVVVNGSGSPRRSSLHSEKSLSR